RQRKSAHVAGSHLREPRVATVAVVPTVGGPHAAISEVALQGGVRARTGRAQPRVCLRVASASAGHRGQREQKRSAARCSVAHQRKSSRSRGPIDRGAQQYKSYSARQRAVTWITLTVQRPAPLAIDSPDLADGANTTQFVSSTAPHVSEACRERDTHDRDPTQRDRRAVARSGGGHVDGRGSG